MIAAASLASSIFWLVAALLMAGGIFWWLLSRSKDPADVTMRVVVTVGVVTMAWFSIDGLAGDRNPAGQFAGVLLGMVFGLCLAFIWAPPLMEKVSDWIGALYTGGGAPPDPEPFYSAARAKRKQGKFREAIYDVQQQLEKFPNDVTGHALLAEIQADDLKDLTAAQITVERFCHHPGRPPAHVAYLLSALADWHLKINKDTDSARLALEQIRERLPDTEQAMMAAQRLAHLASPETLLAAQEHKPIHLPTRPKDLGLRHEADARPAEDPAETAAKLVRQLETHPLDCEAREKLAVIYADHFKRLELATEQLEQLVAAPHQPPKEVARWLHLLADIQVKLGADFDVVRQTLQRIVDRFPGVAAEQIARQRIEHLRLEFKGKEQVQAVKLGSYEKDLGLKGRTGQ